MTDTTPPSLLSDRAVVRLAGEQSRDLLQGLVTQDMRTVQPDQPHWAALLTAQGKVLFDFILWADGESDILIDCEAASADELVKRLTLYRLRRPVTIEKTDLHVHWSKTQGRGVSDPRLAELGYRWIDSTAGQPVETWMEHRLNHGVTEGQVELGTDKTLWLECNARELNGVSFTKGCFVGQENTARMHYRSKVNRRLVVAPINPDDDRSRVNYPQLGLMVTHRRCEDLGDALIPDWLKPALEASAEATAPE